MFGVVFLMIVNLDELLKRVDVETIVTYKDYKILQDYQFKYFFNGDKCFYIGKATPSVPLVSTGDVKR